jgi:hypothetical protein
MSSITSNRIKLMVLVRPGSCNRPAPPNAGSFDALNAHHALKSVQALAILIDIEAFIEAHFGRHSLRCTKISRPAGFAGSRLGFRFESTTAHTS